MFDVKTKGKIVGLNPDLMVLMDNATGESLVTATRSDSSWWEITGPTGELAVETRRDAIAKMVELAQGADAFYTAQVQPGLSKMP